MLQLITAPVLGGAQDVLCRLAEDQLRHSFRVSAATSPGGALPSRLAALGVPVLEVPMERGLHPLGVLRLRRFVRQTGARILHAHGARATLHAYLASRGLPGLALLSHVHLFDAWRFDGSWQARLDRLVSSRCDRVVACSETLRQALVERQGFPPRRTVCIPNGIDLGRFEGRPRRVTDGKLVAGVCARLEPQKGIAHLIDAVALLAGRLPQLVLEVAGDGSLRPELEGRAREAGLGGRVRWLGHRSDIPEVLAGFDLFVLPSLAEGLPLSVIEAMAAGVPVIATAVSGTPELVQHGKTGLLVPPGSPEALAEAICEAFRDPEGARLRAEAARDLVHEHHSVEVMCGRVRALYRDLAASAMR